MFVQDNISIDSKAKDSDSKGMGSRMPSFRTTQTNIATLLENLAQANNSFNTSELDSSLLSSRNLMMKFKSTSSDLQNEFESILDSFNSGKMSSASLEAILNAERQKGLFTMELAEEMGKFLEGICSGIYEMIKNMSVGNQPLAMENVETIFNKLDKAMDTVVGMSRIAASGPDDVHRAINFVKVEQKQSESMKEYHRKRFIAIVEELRTKMIQMKVQSKLTAIKEEEKIGRRLAQESAEENPSPQSNARNPKRRSMAGSKELNSSSGDDYPEIKHSEVRTIQHSPAVLDEENSIYKTRPPQYRTNPTSPGDIFSNIRGRRDTIVLNASTQTPVADLKTTKACTFELPPNYILLMHGAGESTAKYNAATGGGGGGGKHVHDPHGVLASKGSGSDVSASYKYNASGAAASKAPSTISGGAAGGSTGSASNNRTALYSQANSPVSSGNLLLPMLQGTSDGGNGGEKPSSKKTPAGSRDGAVIYSSKGNRRRSMGVSAPRGSISASASSGAIASTASKPSLVELLLSMHGSSSGSSGSGSGNNLTPGDGTSVSKAASASTVAPAATTTKGVLSANNHHSSGSKILLTNSKSSGMESDDQRNYGFPGSDIGLRSVLEPTERRKLLRMHHIRTVAAASLMRIISTVLSYLPVNRTSNSKDGVSYRSNGGSMSENFPLGFRNTLATDLASLRLDDGSANGHLNWEKHNRSPSRRQSTSQPSSPVHSARKHMRPSNVNGPGAIKLPTVNGGKADASSGDSRLSDRKGGPSITAGAVQPLVPANGDNGYINGPKIPHLPVEGIAPNGKYTVDLAQKPAQYGAQTDGYQNRQRGGSLVGDSTTGSVLGQMSSTGLPLYLENSARTEIRDPTKNGNKKYIETIVIYPINTASKATDTSDINDPQDLKHHKFKPNHGSIQFADPPNDKHSEFSVRLHKADNQILFLLESFLKVLSEASKSRLLTAAATDPNMIIPTVMSKLCQLFTAELVACKKDILVAESAVTRCEELWGHLILLGGAPLKDQAVSPTDKVAVHFHHEAEMEAFQRQLGALIHDFLVAHVKINEFKATYDCLAKSDSQRLLRALKHCSDYDASVRCYNECHSKLMSLRDRITSIRLSCDNALKDRVFITGKAATGSSTNATDASGEGKSSEDLTAADNKVAKLANDVDILLKEKQRLEQQCLELQLSKDHTPGALLFFTALQDSAVIPSLQQLSLQITALEAAIQQRDPIDWPLVQRRLLVCADCVPCINRFVSTYSTSHSAWMDSRKKVFERGGYGVVERNIVVCPMCNIDVRAASVSAIVHQGLYERGGGTAATMLSAAGNSPVRHNSISGASPAPAADHGVSSTSAPPRKVSAGAVVAHSVDKAALQAKYPRGSKVASTSNGTISSAQAPPGTRDPRATQEALPNLNEGVSVARKRSAII